MIRKVLSYVPEMTDAARRDSHVALEFGEPNDARCDENGSISLCWSKPDEYKVTLSLGTHGGARYDGIFTMREKIKAMRWL